VSNRSRQTFLKRQKELARQERQRNKSEKRAQRRAEKEKPQMVGGMDPDIAGIVPGPQPLPWELEEEEMTEEAAESEEEETKSAK
jgi:hypothetical protein